MLDDIFSIYFVEAIANGLLLGGLFAILALGLNLIFGVIRIVWVCYAELVMCGMYAVYVLHILLGWPIWISAPGAVMITAALGALLHLLVINPVLKASPINQLLATGGVLFLLQGVATLCFGIEAKTIPFRLPILSYDEVYISFSKLTAFAVAIIAIAVLYAFLRLTYLGTAIRAVAQDRDVMGLLGVDKRVIYLTTSTLGGALAGIASCLLVLQYDVQPTVGLAFGPLTFMICVLGGLGNILGGLLASVILSEIISIGGYFFEVEWGYVFAFLFFIIVLVLRPNGLLRSA